MTDFPLRTAALSGAVLARQLGERFGDFTIRAGFVAATGNGRDFHADVGARSGRAAAG